MQSLPSGPRNRFLVGTLLDMMRDTPGSFRKWATEYGDFVPLRLGPKRAFLLNGPDNIRELLVDQRLNIFRRGDSAKHIYPFFGKGVLVTEGSYWERQRRMMGPAFDPEHTLVYGGYMVSQAAKIIDTWPDWQQCDMWLTMHALVRAGMAKVFFDADVTGPERAFVETLGRTQISMIVPAAKMLLAAPDWVPSRENRRVARAVKLVDDAVYPLIRQRRAHNDHRGDILSILIFGRDTDGFQMTDKQIRDDAVTLYVSSETIPVELTWLWWLLAHHPAVEEKLLQELASVLGGRRPTVADRPQLVYTEKVVKEGLRLYPPVWAVDSVALKDTSIGGHTVRKGSILFTSAYVIHRDPRFFDRPDDFDPDRWTPEFEQSLRPYTYIPVGFEPRDCAGKAIGVLSVIMLLAMLVQEFEIRPAPGAELRAQPALELRPVFGAQMHIKRRASAGDQAKTAAHAMGDRT